MMRIFDVIGDNYDALRATIEAALAQRGIKTVSHYRIDSKYGFQALTSACKKKDSEKFLVPMDVRALTIMLHEWYRTPEAEEIENNEDDDPGNSDIGWRVYVEHGSIWEQDNIAFNLCLYWYPEDK